MPRCPEKRKAYLAAYNEAHKERLRAEARDRMAKVPKEVKAARSRAYRATPKGRATKSQEHYRSAVVAGFRGSFDDWAAQACPAHRWIADPHCLNIDRVVKWRRGWDRESVYSNEAMRYRARYRQDEQFRAKEIAKALARKHSVYGSITTRLREGMRAGAAVGSKTHRLFSLLGYTPEQLRSHLARRFEADMSWQAFWNGEIHIDHIVPLCMFDIEDDVQLRFSTRLTNLQPLWARDNLVKGAKAA